MIKFSHQRGYSLIEILISMALLGLLLPVVFAMIYSTYAGKSQSTKRLEAAQRLVESSEIMRAIRERSWYLIATNGIYHPVPDGNTWTLAENPDTVAGFDRTITIEDAYRNEDGQLVEVGGDIDPSTKKITISIAWTQPLPNSATATFYLTRYLDNLAFTHTTEEDFSAGELQNTTVTVEDDGEVTLGAGGQGSWCSPFDSIVAELDLPKNGVATAVSALEGKVAAGTGENAAGVSFADVVVSNDSPPEVKIDGTFDGYKTNDVFNEGNYGFLATDSNQKEVVVIDTSASPPSETGYFDAPGSDDAMSVASNGNTGFVLTGNKLYNFDLSSKSGERLIIDGDGVDLGATGSSLELVGNYAYVSLRSGDQQLKIVDISNSSDLRVVGQAHVNNTPATRVVVDGAGLRAYLVTEANDQAEFYIIDVETKTGDRSVIGSFEASGMNPKSVTVVPGNKAIMVGHGGEEYQVIDTTNEDNLSRCGGLDLNVNINDIDTVMEGDGDAFSYLVTTDTNSELKVIVGGPGGQHASTGTYTSSIFQTGQASYFNRFDVTTFLPANTELNFQVAVASPADGICETATYSFVGPDGTPDTFFDIGGTIPFKSLEPDYSNPGKCFRYRANFSSTDGVSSAILYDITVNYSP